VLADFNDTINASSMAITDAGWYAGVVTASSDSWIQLDIDTNGALIDLADDAVMFRVTKRTDENTFSVASVTSVPRKTASTTATGGYTNNVTVLVKIDKVGDELVVTDVILASTKASSTATAATANYSEVIK
ncbi:MAG: hypothetical protein IKK44_01730, partial [Clostridium sp.]|nr:hypothetical protein [Clostridium sp.]